MAIRELTGDYFQVWPTDLESGLVQHGHTINELSEGELEMSGVKFIVSAEQI